MFKIDKGIEAPTGRSKYPLKELEIDDSFFVPGATAQTISGSFGVQKPKKFSVRARIEGGVSGVRVWRVA